MKRIALTALFSICSMTACAQPASPQAEGAKIKVAAAAPAAKVELAYAAGSPEERVRAVLKQLNPKIKVDRIGPAPMAGFREVVATGQVVYVSDDGKYLLQGSLLDVASRKDLSEAALAKVRAEVLKTVPMSDRIVYAPAGTPKHTVVVLTDIECGYCRKFHTDIAEYTKRGIQVEYLAFPRAGINSADYRKTVSVWCADDRKKALTDAKNGRPLTAKTCPNPVAMQHEAGLRMGLTGTPMILTADGEFIGGYLPPDTLQQRLDQLAAQRAAGTGA